MFYITFDEKDFVNGIYAGDVVPIEKHQEAFMVTEEVRDKIANFMYTKIMRADGVSDTSIIYDDIWKLVKENTVNEIIVVEEQIDPEKLAMAEAIADLYEQLITLQGGV